MSLPLNASVPFAPHGSAIAGSVLPIRRAEELLATLPGVISVRIVAGEGGGAAVSEIHLLTTSEVAPKQTVRNVESALLAHLGMRVDHRKISVATTSEAPRLADVARAQESAEAGAAAAVRDALRRRIYFEDVEVRRSRSKGVLCRVTLRKDGESVIGEAEGAETERSRAELAARATLSAMTEAYGEPLTLALDGCKLIEAFEREYVFVGVTARHGRDTIVLAGSCEVRESPETASVLAVLDATNRWMGRR